METMKALVKSLAESGIWREEVPVPVAGTNELLIRIVKTGISGTDAHIYIANPWLNS